MQTVAAAAGHGVIQRHLQIVVAEEPVKRDPGFLTPTFVSRDSIRHNAGGHRASGLDRLLIETSSLSILTIEALGTYRQKVVVCFTALDLRKPFQGFESGRNHAVVGRS